jgi:cytoskeletal protein RodZ
MKNFSLQSLLSYLRVFRYAGRARPERDWLTLLLTAFVLLLVSVGWNIWFFINLGNAETVSSVSPVTETTSSAAEITNVQSIFKTRATEQNNYQQSYTFVDPSLPGS